MYLPNSKIKGRLSLGRMFWRIWAAMVLSMLLLGALITLIWRLDVERDRAARPGHEVVVRDMYGEVIGEARVANRLGVGPPTEFEIITNDGQMLWVELPPPRRAEAGWLGLPWATLGWTGLVAALGMIFIAAAVPVVRGLTRRLERLEKGVQKWGGGDLSARLPVEGRDEVAVLAQRFNDAATQIEALVAAHKVLLANASHELRSPLARVRMGLALLEQDAPQAEPTIRAIERDIRELDDLIDEVLLASRLEHNPADVNVGDEVDLLALVVEEGARSGVAVAARSHVQVRGNPMLLQRMVRNLLENALKYGRGAGGVAQVELSLTASTQSEEWWLDVADRGPGVPNGWRERIFEPFARPPHAGEQHGSAGLGLSLVRAIAHRHGMQVRCLARDGGGSVFRVSGKIVNL